jgi:hypothetical protein
MGTGQLGGLRDGAQAADSHQSQLEHARMGDGASSEALARDPTGSNGQ